MVRRRSALARMCPAKAHVEVLGALRSLSLIRSWERGAFAGVLIRFEQHLHSFADFPSNCSVYLSLDRQHVPTVARARFLETAFFCLISANIPSRTRPSHKTDNPD
jgi:hypothetical protein